MRLIDADAFFEDFPEIRDYEYASQSYEVEAEPVKHGRWIGHQLSSMVTCSVCGVVGWNRYYNYCPNCGARMFVEGAEE